MNARTQRAMQMMKNDHHASQLDSNTFRIRSQTDPTKSYIVSKTRNGLVCECPDHVERKADCKHIKVVLNVLKQNRGFANAEFKIMERSKLKLCKYCDSGNLKKMGFRKTKSGQVQVFGCKDCKKRFTANFGFEKKQFEDTIIAQALQIYYSKMSVRRIADHFEMIGVDVSYKTIYNWIRQYSRMTVTYIDGIVPRSKNRAIVRADEVWVKINGQQCYLFASMDSNTRYWVASDLADNKFQHNADSLFLMTKHTMGKAPAVLISDKLQAYGKSSKRVFGKKTQHISNAGIPSRRNNGGKYHPNNQMMERLNGEIRDREKVFRGLKTMDTAVLQGMRVYYNFTKKHGSLDGRTPAEQALIKVEGKNKWKTLIQNASLNKLTE